MKLPDTDYVHYDPRREPRTVAVKRCDWVWPKDSRNGGAVMGIVRRVALDGSWVDVRWRSGGEEWSKRMPASALVILHTIPFAGGTVTDMTRERELGHDPDCRGCPDCEGVT